MFTDGNMFAHYLLITDLQTKVGTAEKVSKLRILKGTFLRILNDVFGSLKVNIDSKDKIFLMLEQLRTF